MKRKQPERQLQKDAFEFMALALPADAFFTAIPGGDRGVTLTPGYTTGTPDALVLWRGISVFPEFKAKRGRVSELQAWAHVQITMAGGYVGVCRSIEELEALLRKAGIPLRASTGYREAA